MIITMGLLSLCIHMCTWISKRHQQQKANARPDDKARTEVGIDGRTESQKWREVLGCEKRKAVESVQQ